MEKEFNLSEKRLLDNEVPRCYYLEEDVKEAIRILKNRIFNPLSKEDYNIVCEELNAIAGEKLI
jgi:hypothetical protein